MAEDAGTSLATAAPAATAEPAAAPAAAPVAAEPAAPAAPAQAPAVQAPAAEPAKPVEPAKPAAPQETPEAKATREAAEAAAKVPEKYEFKLPEGVTLDAEIAGQLEAFAKANKLTQGEAQRLADLKVVEQQQLAAIQGEWRKAAEADSEFGGPKLKENMAIAQKALQFASPQMKAMLDKTGFGNNAEVIRWMYRVGQKLGEDSFVPGARAPANAADIASKLYPTNASK